MLSDVAGEAVGRARFIIFFVFQVESELEYFLFVEPENVRKSRREKRNFGSIVLFLFFLLFVRRVT